MTKVPRRATATAGALILLATGCGARLTAAQEAALNGNDGSNAGSSSSGGSTQALGGSSGPAGASPSAGSPSGGGSSSSGGSSSGSSQAAGGSGRPTGGGAPTGGSTSRSGGTVAAANDPIAGLGGKLCPSGAPSSDPGVSSKSITVGNIATVNGPVPGLFAGARYGAQAVAAYINSLGGICGRQLVVDSADDQFDQATDQNEASSMANQVLAFMGSFSLQDGGIPAGAPNVPDVGESLSSQRFQSPMNFSPQPNAPGYQTSAYQYFVSSPQYHNASQHMAMLVENTPQTATTGAWEQAALQSAGFKFIFVDKTLQPTDPTFNGDVQKMKAAGVQGVIFQATGTIIGQLANAMYQAGMTIVLGNYCPAAYDPAYIQNAGPGTNGTVLSQAIALYDGQDANAIPMVATLDQWYNRVNPGQVPDIYAVYAWMSGLLLAQAINTAGAPTRADIVAGIKQIGEYTGDGLAPPSNPATKTPPTCFVLIDVKNGQFVRDPATPSGFKCSPAGYYHAS
jgi:ABC-type branched-subunit amino acid transport system substrate-binding protein